MTRGLALSGGGARGSFQMGAIDCLYTVFGYRPEVMLAVTLAATAGGPYQDQLIVHHDGNPARASSILIRATIP